MLSSLGSGLLRFLVRSFHMRTSLSCGLISLKSSQICDKISKGNCFWILCWQGSLSLTQECADRQQVLLLGPPFNATANLSSLVHVQVLEPFSLYKEAVTSICCLSPRPGAQRSSGADCKFIQLTQCGVFLTFEENISREEIPSSPKLPLNNT